MRKNARRCRLRFFLGRATDFSVFLKKNLANLTRLFPLFRIFLRKTGFFMQIFLRFCKAKTTKNADFIPVFQRKTSISDLAEPAQTKNTITILRIYFKNFVRNSLFIFKKFNKISSKPIIGYKWVYEFM